MNVIVDYMLKSNDERVVVNDYIENDPLSENNLDKTLNLVNEFRLSSTQKSIWIYSGYQWEDIFDVIFCRGFQNYEKLNQLRLKRKDIVSQCTVMIDGQYIDSQRNLSIPWCGSENQRVIDIQKTLQQHSLKGEIELWRT